MWPHAPKPATPRKTTADIAMIRSPINKEPAGVFMIYIVEDDSSIRELEQYALQTNGYEAKGLSLIHI